MLYKKFLFFILLGLLWIDSSAQLYGGFGYERGIARMKNLDYIADIFNQEWFTTKRMNKFRFPGGEYLSVGYLGDGGFFELGWHGNRQNMTARLPSAQSVIRKTVRINISTFDLGGGVALNKAETGSTFLGASLNLGWFRATIDPSRLIDFNRPPLYNKMMVAAKVFFRFEVKEEEDAWLPFIIQPYFQYNFTQLEFIQIHRSVNPATSRFDGVTTLTGRPLNGGILLAFLFNTGKKIN